jgi:hypothetical protein
MSETKSVRRRGFEFWLGDVRFFIDLAITLVVSVSVFVAGVLYSRLSFHSCMVQFGDAAYCRGNTGTDAAFLVAFFLTVVVLMSGAALAIRRWTRRFLSRTAGVQSEA